VKIQQRHRKPAQSRESNSGVPDLTSMSSYGERTPASA
jgi:hypothetical protein